MRRQIILHRPWTCRWGRFGEVAASGETASFVFWSCAHPALSDGAQLLGADACTACPLWAVSSRLTAEMGDRLEDNSGHQTGGLRHRLIGGEPGRSTST